MKDDDSRKKRIIAYVIQQIGVILLAGALTALGIKVSQEELSDFSEGKLPWGSIEASSSTSP